MCRSVFHWMAVLGLLFVSLPCSGQTTGGGDPGEEEAMYCYVQAETYCADIVEYLIDVEDEPILYGCGGCEDGPNNTHVCIRAGDKAVYPDAFVEKPWIKRGPLTPDGESAGKREYEEAEEEQCGLIRECQSECYNTGDEYLCDSVYVKPYQIKPRTISGDPCRTIVF
jgi:hypothetical protein